MRLVILSFAFLAPLSAQFPVLDLHQPTRRKPLRGSGWKARCKDTL